MYGDVASISQFVEKCREGSSPGVSPMVMTRRGGLPGPAKVDEDDDDDDVSGIVRSYRYPMSCGTDTSVEVEGTHDRASGKDTSG